MCYTCIRCSDGEVICLVLTWIKKVECFYMATDEWLAIVLKPVTLGPLSFSSGTCISFCLVSCSVFHYFLLCSVLHYL